MRRTVTTLLLAAFPALAVAQMPLETKVVTSSYDLFAPNAVVHVDNLQIGGRVKIHTLITADDGAADLMFDGRTITFGDGYALAMTTLANTPGAFVARFAANAPDGESATAIIGLNLQTREVTSAGMEDVTRLLRRSHDAAIAGRVLPLVSVEHAPGLSSGSSSSASLWPAGGRLFKPRSQDCLTSGVTFEIAAAAALGTCANPATALACLAAISQLGIQGYSMATGGCIFYYDNTIGWG